MMPFPKGRYVPSWEPLFLAAIKNGYNEQIAAKSAGVGTADVKRRAEQDEVFKTKYEDAWNKRKARPGAL